MRWAAGLAIAYLAASSALAQEPPPLGEQSGAESAPVDAAPSAGAPDGAELATDLAVEASPTELGSSAVAPAQTADPDPVFERLLGSGAPDPLPPAASPAASEPLDIAPPWLWGVLIVAAAGLLWLRGRVTAVPGGAPSLRVVGRTLLGREGNLAVVEVADGDRTRRMLIGYGGGAPRLVAELADGAGEEDAAPAPAGGFATALRRSLGREAPPDAPVPEGAATPELRSRDDLIAEVLAERSTVVGGDPVAAGHDDDEDDPANETYTFRGLLG